MWEWEESVKTAVGRKEKSNLALEMWAHTLGKYFKKVLIFFVPISEKKKRKKESVLLFMCIEP